MIDIKRLPPQTKPSSYSDYLATADYWPLSDVEFMQAALALAKKGAAREEVPVGAVLVHEGRIIGEGFNQPILSCDPTSHAEIVALREACSGIQNYRLPANTTLYVTLEPCTMCLGALIHARLARLVFATQEPRAGMVGSQLNLTKMDFYNHKIEVSFGLLQPDSQKILKSFFKARRNKKKNK
ncbi:tRNA adenosine(34) deaminase TadA [Psychrobacter phenylpyruvicus]|uniref:tRNA-specific adenosine deaminase n=1 Tax=Psychrobacter phenylpyruvicus TaxID=29432 RepID=A0A379LIV7_9GAMM|nr:tRNA adenosine(34) deaminase TadA [Psychrobacter phenylpyruvicus]SUD90468.1 tRNA-specific adenosine deaminase [Psychrobacter phenylpyruvicus]